MAEEYNRKLNMSAEADKGREDDDLLSRIELRRRKIVTSKRRKRRLTLFILVVLFALLATMCGRDIVRLKAENSELKKEQAELNKERDELKEELLNTGKQEYIREQARKQLRLLNPGEILFTFDEDEENKADKNEENEEDASDSEKGEKADEQ